MSRHRSPSGRHAHGRSHDPAVAFPGAPAVRRQQGVRTTSRAPSRPAQHRATTVRRGMTAAAAGGAMAALIPAVAVTGPVADATAREAGSSANGSSANGALRLTAEGRPAGIALLAALAPVQGEPEPEPAELSVAELVKAAGLADAARQAEAEQAAREAAARCEADLAGLGAVKPWVHDATQFLSCLYEQPAVSGLARRSRQSDHPSGHAVDLMVGDEQGDRIADCALANRDELGITYVIWQQRVNYGDGWESMSDRGGETENHYDHVHISFARSAPEASPVAARCP